MPTMAIKHQLSLPVAVFTKTIDRKAGVVQAIVSVSGNLDSDGDVVCPGASDYGLKTLAAEGLRPKGVWSHDWDTPIAKALKAEEVMPGNKSLPGKLMKGGLGGLRIEMQFNLEAAAIKANEAFSMVNFFGDEQQWSVGHLTVESYRGGQGVMPDEVQKALGGFDRGVLQQYKALAEGDATANFITKWITYEFSPVLFGSNSGAATESIKALEAQAEPLEKIVERIVVKSIADLASPKNEPTLQEAKTQFDQRVSDVEEAVMYLSADLDTKAGRVQATRNLARLRSVRDVIAQLLTDAGDEADDGKALTLPEGAVKVYLNAPMEGSVEERQQALAEAVSDAFPAPDGDNPYWVSVVATYDTWVLVSVDDYDNDAPDYFVFTYTMDDDDSCTLSAATPVEVGMVIEGLDDDAGTDPDFPTPSTGLSMVVPQQVTTTGEAGFTPPPGRKNHKFKPSASNAAECATCGAGATRPWHKALETDNPVSPDFQRALMEFALLTEGVSG